MDRIATMTYPDGEVLTYSYGAHGKLSSVSSSTSVSYLSSLSYNRSLQPKVLTLGSGAATTLLASVKRCKRFTAIPCAC